MANPKTIKITIPASNADSEISEAGAIALMKTVVAGRLNPNCDVEIDDEGVTLCSANGLECSTKLPREARQFLANAKFAEESKGRHSHEDFQIKIEFPNVGKWTK